MSHLLQENKRSGGSDCCKCVKLAQRGMRSHSDPLLISSHVQSTLSSFNALEHSLGLRSRQAHLGATIIVPEAT